jgi:hypothetical protein
MMTLAATWMPLGIPSTLLGVILLAVGFGLFAHYALRSRGLGEDREQSTAGRIFESLVAPRRLRVSSKPPFVLLERTGERWTVMEVDAELYWAAALTVGGIGALLASLG